MPVTPTPTLSGFNYCYQEVTINVIQSGDIEYYDCDNNYYIEFVSGGTVTITGSCLNIETFNGLDAIIQVIYGNIYCATPTPTPSPTPTVSPCSCISVYNRYEVPVNFTYTYCNSSVANVLTINPFTTIRFCVKNYVTSDAFIITQLGGCNNSSSCNSIVTPTPTTTLTPTPTPSNTLTPSPTGTSTPVPSNTLTPTPTITFTPTPTITPTKFLSPTSTPSITDKPTPTPTPTPTITPTKFISPTSTPSITDKPTPTPTLTDKPTQTPFSTPIPTSGTTNVCKCVKTVTFDIISVNRFIPQKNRKIIYKDCCGNKQEYIIKQKTPINNYTIPCVNCNNLCFEVNSVYAENLTIRNIRYNENQPINCCNCIPLLTPIPTTTPTITPTLTPTLTPLPTPNRTLPPTPTPTLSCSCKKYKNLTPRNYEFKAFDCNGNYISGIWNINEEKCIDTSYGRISGLSVNFVECCSTTPTINPSPTPTSTPTFTPTPTSTPTPTPVPIIYFMTENDEFIIT